MRTLPTAEADALARLRDQLGEVMVTDAHRLGRRLASLARVDDPARRRAGVQAISQAVETARQRVQSRVASIPALRYDEQLPVVAHRADLVAALRDHQVVVVAGETGSGKSTQLPKLCLEAGRGRRGLIGQTQPRRIAARSIAERIAEELDVALGDAVGYQVRFTNRTTPRSLVKVMTDGVLLAEISHDRDLTAYDTIIIDEAHERSLTIDFLLGYLRTLLPRRPDLHVLITSATIDPARFSRHFDDAPAYIVSGRTYPVEIRYRPLVAPATVPARHAGPDTPRDPDPASELAAEADVGRAGERDQTEAVLDAVDELCAEGPGDILVFLSGEREIRDTTEALRRHLAGRPARLRGEHVELVPLYARLSAAEQHRVFASHPGRRVVLATNVAETSLTVPGIRYVVDTGTARISRYSRRLKVQRLPIEPVSQASADQRAGRCGRVAPGVCIRLYDEADLRARPRYTEPEILRTNLASVILAMAALHLGDLADFPFIDPPDRRAVRDGLALLEELGALTPTGTLTPTGRDLARLPVDPRLGRMILQAGRTGCLREVLVIAAALSIQDPRERPADKREAADAAHRRFADPTSDFMSLWNLWEYLREQAASRSSGAFRRMCTAEFIHYLRVREWQELVGALRGVAAELHLTPNTDPATPETIHRALLAGLLSHVGAWDAARRDYLGARGARFAVWPGSSLARRPAQWVVAGELVETSRLWGRTLARVSPEWVEPLAAHLVTRTYSEPRWDRRRGTVIADERVSLYGLSLIAGRHVDYARVDPPVARELFIRHALVAGEWDARHRFRADNERRLARIAELEHRLRRRDIVVDEEAVFAFYDARVPADVVSASHFDAWWKREQHRRPHLLDLDAPALVTGAALDVDRTLDVEQAAFPDTWRQDDLELALTYRFEPGAPDDGLTVHVPLAVAGRVHPEGFDWQVPGRREELVAALLRSLPKPVRRAFVPLPEHARALAQALPVHLPDGPDVPSITVALAEAARRHTGVGVQAADFDWATVPDHLRPTFVVTDSDGAVVARDKDLSGMVARLGDRVRAEVARVGWGIERTGLRDWQLGTLPDTVRRSVGGVEVVGYPALVDEGTSVAVAVLASGQAARTSTRRGLRRLLLVTLPSPAKAVLAGLPATTRLALARFPRGGTAVLDDCLGAALDMLIDSGGGPPVDEAGFRALHDHVRPRLVPTVTDLAVRAARVLELADQVTTAGDRLRGDALAAAAADIRAQVTALTGPGFVSAAGAARLPDLERYLRAAGRRAEQLPSNVPADRTRQEVIERVTRAYAELLATLPRREHAAAAEIRWLIEELRVSLFAQALGTPVRVSEQRIQRRIDELRA